MIGVILSALKILGIILLAIIALVLLIILMVLFIPVRYKGKIYFKKTPDIDFSITWFLKFLSVNIKYKDGLDIVGKIGWFFKVYSNKNEETNTLEEDVTKEECNISENKQGSVKEKETLKENIAVEKTKTDTTATRDIKKDTKKIKDLEAQEKKASKAKRTEKKKAKENREEKKDYKEQSKLDKILNKIKDIHYLLTYDENKKVLLLMLEKLKKILVHILPKKIVGFFKFGFDDPSTTGQVLEGVAIFYPLYKDDFKIVPMFYEEIIEVDISFKGRLRIFYAAYIALILWLNKKRIKTRPK